MSAESSARLEKATWDAELNVNAEEAAELLGAAGEASSEWTAPKSGSPSPNGPCGRTCCSECPS
eukprot:12725862-Alexandrium_andersonii.AAC.1